VAVADTAAAGDVADFAVSNEYFPSAALQILERQTSAIEGIAHLLQLVVQRLPAPGATPAPEVGQLRQEVANLRTLLDASEKTQQADLDQLRSWMTRVIRNRGNAGLALPARLGMFLRLAHDAYAPILPFYGTCFAHRSAHHQSAGLRKDSLHWPICAFRGVGFP